MMKADMSLPVGVAGWAGRGRTWGGRIGDEAPVGGLIGEGAPGVWDYRRGSPG